MTSAATAADPHQGVQESVTVVSRLHREVHTILVVVRVNSVRHIWVINLIKYILRAR